MLKFKENVIGNIIKAMEKTGAKIVASPKVTQAVINSMQKSKNFPNDITLISSESGLILAKTREVNTSNPVLFVEDAMIEFTGDLTSDLHHANNDTKAEFRYYPEFHQMLRVRSRNGSDVILADDDHNIYRVSKNLRHISAKKAVIPIFFPKLVKERTDAEQIITASNKARGMDTIKVGDTVIVREYQDIAKEFGDEEITFGYDGETMRIAGNIKGADTLVYSNYATYLGGRKFKVKAVLDERQEIILTEDQFKLVNPKTSSEVANVDPIRFSRLHFIKA